MTPAMANPVIIVDYDPDWPGLFQSLRKRIADALGAMAAAIEHVGSTAVPNLAFHQATIEAGDALEDKLMDLAHEGNVTAAIFLLKGARPQKYKDRNELSFQWDGDPGKLTEPQLEKVIEWLEAMAPGQIAQPKRPALPPGAVIDVEPLPPE